jgi:hypothetical protein
MGSVSVNRSGASAQQDAATSSMVEKQGQFDMESDAATNNSASVKKSNGKVEANKSSSFEASAAAKR